MSEKHHCMPDVVLHLKIYNELCVVRLEWIIYI